MTFGQSIRTCFGNYATFSGRARRPEYWWFFLFIFLANMVLSVLDNAIFGTGTVGEPGPTVLSSIFALAVLVPTLAVGWRRMHDTGRPGWWLLIPLILSAVTFAGLFMGIVGFSMIESAGGDANALMILAGRLGIAGIIIAALLQLIMTFVLLWWLTRPSQPGPNQYGPEPKP